jgi:hypothetical protein
MIVFRIIIDDPGLGSVGHMFAALNRQIFELPSSAECDRG